MKFLRKIPWMPITLVALIFVASVAIRLDAASGQVDESLELSTRLDNLLTSRNFRGAALVVQDGEIVLRAAYGMACDKQGIPNTVYSPFHIASVAKNFTGAAILLLEQDGKLCTSDSLDNFFTGGDWLEDITVAHLLAMRGGFYDYAMWMWVSGGPSLEYVEEALAITIEELEAYIIEYYWSGATRNRPAYCNTDYWLLGRIIEKVSGMPYEEFIASRLFEPAGMENSGISGINEAVAPHGAPVIYVDGVNFLDPNNWPFFFAYSTGGLVSTIDDLNLWLDAYFGGKLFPAYLLDDIQVGVYNYGWLFDGDAIWHHAGGGMPGFSSHIIYDRSSSTRVILLSNNWTGTTSVNRSLIRAVSDMVLGVTIDGFAVPRG